MKSANDHIALFREFMALDRKRTAGGVTPLEHRRWLDLKQKLAHRFPSRAPSRKPERRGSARVATRLSVEFESPGEFQRATIRNISRGGLFISTPFVADIGTQLVLRILVASTGDRLELPCVVVSNGVADGFATQELGMGVRFDHLSPGQERRVEEIRAKALVEATDPD